ncbi:MAG: lysophospholipid acyltransferase family protein [Geminicoccaceae bacterium]
MLKRSIRGAVRGVLFLTLTAVLLVLYLPAMVLGRRAMLAVHWIWCGATARLLGVRIKHAGQPFTDCPTLFVANHVSYLDVPALGGFLDATFIAKSEVASWPLFGLLGRLTRTMFIRRHWRQALVQRNALAACLRAGESFILFGEGTSSNGLCVRPIKTSLLSVAEPWILDCPIAVQPVTLAYTRLAEGPAVGPENCDLYAWHADATLLPHLWNVLQLGGVELLVTAGNPVLSWSVASRKTLGRALRDQLLRDLAQSTAGPCSGAEQSQLSPVPVGAR